MPRFSPSLSIDHFEISVNFCDLMYSLNDSLTASLSLPHFTPLSPPSLSPSINTHSHTNRQKYTQTCSQIHSNRHSQTDKNTHTTPCSGYSTTIQKYPPTDRRISRICSILTIFALSIQSSHFVEISD